MFAQSVEVAKLLLPLAYLDLIISWRVEASFRTHLRSREKPDQDHTSKSPSVTQFTTCQICCPRVVGTGKQYCATCLSQCAWRCRRSPVSYPTFWQILQGAPDNAQRSWHILFALPVRVGHAIRYNIGRRKCPTRALVQKMSALWSQILQSWAPKTPPKIT